MKRFRVASDDSGGKMLGGDRLARPRFRADGGQHRIGGAILDPARGERRGQR